MVVVSKIYNIEATDKDGLNSAILDYLQAIFFDKALHEEDKLKVYDVIAEILLSIHGVE